MSTTEQEVSSDLTSNLEYQIYDLRHQLITHTMYHQDGLQYADHFEQAPPITIAEENNQNGAIVQLYLDNSWGVRQGRINSSSQIFIPHIVMQNWGTIRHPDFQELKKWYLDELKRIEQERLAGRLRNYTFNDLFNATHCEYFHTKNALTLEYSEEIKKGIHSDLAALLKCRS